MISFGPTEEQQLARDSMREYAREAMRPIARECDESSSIPGDFLAQAWQLGLTSTPIPEEYGGGGEPNSPMMNALVLEELGHGDAALALAAVTPSLFVKPLVEQGTEGQKKKYLPPFCGNKFHVGSLALVEPTPVFDPVHPQTVAKPKGDRFIVSGVKRLVPLADRASHFLVLAGREASKGVQQNAIEAFVVPRDAKGLSISEAEHKLGLKALPTYSLTLDGVEVPAEDRLGGEAAFDGQRLLNLCRTALAAVMTGVTRAVMEYAIPYAKDRVAFDEPIAQKQAIAFKLSNMQIETNAMRWLVWKAASELEKGVDASRSAHFARSYAAEHCMKIADDGVQVLGGHGYIREHPVEMWYRNARTLGVLEGTVAI